VTEGIFLHINLTAFDIAYAIQLRCRTRLIFRQNFITVHFHASTEMRWERLPCEFDVDFIGLLILQNIDTKQLAGYVVLTSSIECGCNDGF
jgi:hypothetical protein